MSIRVQDLAKIKGNKLVLSKTKLELAAVRPGALSDDGVDESIRYDEDRLKLLRVLVSEKAKGTYHRLFSGKQLMFNLDVKTLIQKIKILGEISRETGATTRCFILDLNSLDCRKGCNVCGMEKIAKKLQDGFESMKEGPGNNMNYMNRIIT